MADLVEETVQGDSPRLRELAPVVAEYERLQAAYAALEGRGADSADWRSTRTGARSGPATCAGREAGGVRHRCVRGPRAVRTRRRCLA